MREKDFFSFEKLDVWQLSRSYCIKVYRLIKDFPAEERYGLCDQLRRCVTSVSSNIAEGCGRVSLKEKAHFLEIAYGSLMESFCQLQIAHDLGYLMQEELTSVRDDVYSIARMLISLRHSYQEKPTSPHNP